MFNRQNTMRRMRHMARDTLRGLVAAGGLCVVAGGARADANHQGPPSTVTEVRRELAAVGDVAGLVSGYPEILPALAPPGAKTSSIFRAARFITRATPGRPSGNTPS